MRRFACGGLQHQAPLRQTAQELRREFMPHSFTLPTVSRQDRQPHGNKDLSIGRQSHAIAPRARLRPIHRSSAVTEKAQSNNNHMAYYCAFAYVGDFYCKTRTIRLREQSQEARPSASGPGFGLVEDPIKTQYKTKQPPPPPLQPSSPGWSSKVRSRHHGTSRTRNHSGC